MSTTFDRDDELAELLARATEVEQKAVEAATLLADPDEDLTPDAREDLESQRQAALLGLPELHDRIEELQDTILAMQAGTAPGEDPAADAEADDLPADADDWDDDDDDGLAVGVDFDDFDDEATPVDGNAGDAIYDPTLMPAGDEGKAYEACPECGSTGVDELAGGARQCEDCGWPLEEAKGFDFEDDGVDADGVVQLTEMELLRARRESLQ